MILSNNEINAFLGLYSDNFKLVKNVDYSNGTISAELVPYKYTYTQDDLDYITATQINLYLSQLTYILAGCAIKDKNFVEISNGLYEVFIENMFKGRLFFVNINQKMKKPIFKNKDVINAFMKIVRIKKSNQSIFAKIHFSFETDSSFGDLLIGMKIKE